MITSTFYRLNVFQSLFMLSGISFFFFLKKNQPKVFLADFLQYRFPACVSAKMASECREMNSVCFSHEAKTAMACRVSFYYICVMKALLKWRGDIKRLATKYVLFFRVCIPHSLWYIRKIRHVPFSFLFFTFSSSSLVYSYLFSSFTDPHNVHLAFDLSAFFLFLFGHLPTCILIAYLLLIS